MADAAYKVQRGRYVVTDLDEAMQNAATKGAQLAASLKNIAANALPILIISATIRLAQKIWDGLNVTVEELETKVNSLQAAYQNLRSEYEQLSGKH